MPKEKKDSGSKLGQIIEIWGRRDDMPLGEWVSDVSAAYFDSSLDLLTTADLLEVQPAELHAALSLATLSEESLELVSVFNPPITTWYFLADCPDENVEEVLDAIQNRPSGVAAGTVAANSVREKLGPSISERVGALDSKIFAHLAAKATQHDALRDKDRNALKGFGLTLSRGKALTPNQIKYALGLIEKLAEEGVISANSPDGDKEMMMAVLDVLHK